MSGLAILAAVIPQSGKGLTRDEIEALLQKRGVDLGSGRLAALLYYLTSYEMVTRDGDRYLQARKVDL